MKRRIFSIFMMTLLYGTACNNTPEQAADATKECETLIHGFYTWYDAFQVDTLRSVNFTKDDGEHLTLDAAKLDVYLAHFKESGFVSDGFVQTQKNLYQKCEKLWQNEQSGDVPSCLDADLYFCAQDWDIEFWTKAAVSVDFSGDKATALMKGTEGGGPREQHFQLVKEDGKWKIEHIECDMGIE